MQKYDLQVWTFYFRVELRKMKDPRLLGKSESGSVNVKIPVQVPDPPGLPCPKMGPVDLRT